MGAGRGEEGWGAKERSEGDGEDRRGERRRAQLVLCSRELEERDEEKGRDDKLPVLVEDKVSCTENEDRRDDRRVEEARRRRQSPVLASVSTVASTGEAQ